MKRGAGLLALFAILLGGIHFAAHPAALQEPSSLPAAERAEPEPASAPREDTTCQSFEYPAGPQGKIGATEQNPVQTSEIARLVDRFLYGAGQSSRLAPGGLPQGIRLMVVAVPDPRHTHLSLQFDRSLEAVQQAAQDEGYTYDSSWLPWKNVNPEYSNLADRNAEMKDSARREVCPGLILFRRTLSALLPDNCKASAEGGPRQGDIPYQCGMVVFVVGEQPTAGLNRVQWDNALHWIDRFASKTRPDKAMRVLGPTFSGSLPSYVRALEVRGMYAGTFTSTLLYSGRIRGCASWRWFNQQLNPPIVPGTPPPTNVQLPVRLANFEENDALQTNRLFRYLVDRGHHLSEVAVLSEDETAYGGLPDYRLTEPDQEGAILAPTPAADDDGYCNPEAGRSDRPVHLYYPRDISAVRSAYQEQSIFSSSSGTDSSSQSHSVLHPQSGQTASEGGDTIESFSGNNLALTQEAQLYGIVNTLKTHGIRFILLRSTNTLDYLFLTRFMHRAYPTAYIITSGSDLLFGREVDSTEFRGVMALSSFPLLPRGQDWTPQTQNLGQHAHRVFGSFTMEGAYLAARFLITDPGVTPQGDPIPYLHPAKANIPDYAPPFWERGKEASLEPATWLSVIGRDGYWPIATLKETLQRPEESRRFPFVSQVKVQAPSAAGLQPGVAPRPQRMSLSASWRFFCVLAVVIFGVHCFACRYGYRRQNLGMLVQFAPMDNWRGSALMAIGWAAICCLLLLLCMTTARILTWLDLVDKIWFFAVGLVSLSAFFWAARELWWWITRPARQARPKRGRPANHGDAQVSVKPTGHFRQNPDRPKIGGSRLGFARLLTLIMVLVIALFFLAIWLMFDFGRGNESGVTTAYRSVHLISGVSPVMSFIAMLAGFYFWFWQSLSGLALLGEGRPVLPRSKAERGAHLGNEFAKSIERVALPFPTLEKSTALLYLLPFFFVLLLAIILQRAWMQTFDLLLHSMENVAFNWTLHVLIALGLYVILLESLRLYSTWLVLKRLLKALDRLPLRRTFAALPGLSMHSLWRLSGSSSRARLKTFSRQLESLIHLRNRLDSRDGPNCGTIALRRSVRRTCKAGRSYVDQRRSGGQDLAMANDPRARTIRRIFQRCSELVMDDLLLAEWQREQGSLVVENAAGEGDAHDQIALSDNKVVQAGEEFLCLIYVGYLQNLLGAMRTTVLAMVGIFAAIALSMGFYPYTPRPTISLSLLFLLLFIGSVVGVVFAGLDRDSTLSHITNTKPGELGTHFWLRMVSFVGVPALGLIVAQFPEITDFVFSWITPTMNSMK